MTEEPIRILIVEARFYEDLADALLEGATQALTAFGAEYDVVTVPGALEIPAAIALAEDSGHRPVGKLYDGYVALGTVIRARPTTSRSSPTSRRAVSWTWPSTSGSASATVS